MASLVLHTVLREPDDSPADLTLVPLLGKVAAGNPIFAEENHLGDVFVERRIVANGRHFALRVTGESMRDVAICDGDVVIVRQQPVAEHGDIVVALLDDEAMVKRLSIREHEIELRPENPNFPRCSTHKTGIAFTSLSSDNPLGSRPETIASTMSGANSARRMTRPT